VVEDFIWRLTGKQTMYQMIAFAEEIVKRGGTPLDPLAYKKMYLDRLHARIAHRLDELRRPEASPDKYLVPGTRALVEALTARGLRLYLARRHRSALHAREGRTARHVALFRGPRLRRVGRLPEFRKRS
jgi:hypothetical protein